VRCLSFSSLVLILGLRNSFSCRAPRVFYRFRFCCVTSPPEVRPAPGAPVFRPGPRCAVPTAQGLFPPDSLQSLFLPPLSLVSRLPEFLLRLPLCSGCILHRCPPAVQRLDFSSAAVRRPVSFFRPLVLAQIRTGLLLPLGLFSRTAFWLVVVLGPGKCQNGQRSGGNLIFLSCCEFVIPAVVSTMTTILNPEFSFLIIVSHERTTAL
jgi:hypothetical protein